MFSAIEVGTTPASARQMEGRTPSCAWLLAAAENEALLQGPWQRLQGTVDGLQTDLSDAFPLVPSPRMCAFAVFAEDRRFPHHPGFDPLALCRAAWRTSFGGPRQGGSTIAMQLVRTVLGRREPTLRRKVAEIVLAVRLSRHVPVEKIPALYLWAAYYGWNMEGFGRACAALDIDPRCSTPAEDAELVARLKYPQPKSDDAAQVARIRGRVAHIIEWLGSGQWLNLERKMTPFKIPPSMETFTDTCPSGTELLKVAHEGGSDACAALARTWISEGIPVAFERCPAVYDSMRVWLADELSVHPKQIGLTGSARFGSSFAASKVGQSFGRRSDLDIFVVSESLFRAYRADFVNWRDDFRSGEVVPRSSKERGHWEENTRLIPRNMRRGFIDVRFIPSRPQYEMAQRTLDAMFRLVRKLAMTPCSPAPRKASVRCYVDWSDLIRQVGLSLGHSSLQL